MEVNSFQILLVDVPYVLIKNEKPNICDTGG